MRDSVQSTLQQNLELAALMQSAVQHSEDFQEAVAAVFEKREPRFSGR
jgi:enoyl-CoA hydratase/carnithine racemase